MRAACHSKNSHESQTQCQKTVISILLMDYLARNNGANRKLSSSRDADCCWAVKFKDTSQDNSRTISPNTLFIAPGFLTVRVDLKPDFGLLLRAAASHGFQVTRCLPVLTGKQEALVCGVSHASHVSLKMLVSSLIMH